MTVRILYLTLFSDLSDTKIQIKRICLFAVCIFIAHYSPVYMILWPLRTNPNIKFYSFMVILQSPALFFLYYILERIIFKLSVKRSVYCAQYLYIMFNLITMVYVSLRLNISYYAFGGFEYVGSPSYYIADGLAQLMCVFMGVIGYFILRKIMVSVKALTDISNPATVSKSTKKLPSIILGLITCLANYIISFLFIIWMIYDENNIIQISIVALILLILGMSLMLFGEMLAMGKYITRLKDFYIASLTESIDNFSGLRHDFANLLQTYQGYIDLKDFDSLEKYHNQLFMQTRTISDQMHSFRRLERSPAILGLLYNAVDKAKDKGVEITFSTLNADDNPLLQTVELSRIVSILMNNAIESAAESNKKSIQFSINKEGRIYVIIISNSTKEEHIDTSNIFKKGYTSKEQHSGQGLWEISKIISKSEVYSVHCNHQKGIFTAFVQIMTNSSKM